jgi:enterobactin synthetase component D / holo-[acyl-carrier protein] synthase
MPAGVAVAESFGAGAPTELYPEEALAVARAAENRRREFAAVRHCARSALAALGVPPVAVPAELDAPEPWARRAPVWPPGITGSMTHCDGYRAAVAARQELLLAVGIDAEPHDALHAGVLDRVSLAEERVMLAALAARRPDVAWDRLLFSAKESVYKAWYPLTRAWLGFEECRVEITADGELRAVLLVPGPEVAGVRLGEFAGRWRALPRHLATMITVPAVSGGPVAAR